MASEVRQAPTNHELCWDSLTLQFVEVEAPPSAKSGALARRQKNVVLDSCRQHVCVCGSHLMSLRNQVEHSLKKTFRIKKLLSILHTTDFKILEALGLHCVASHY